MLRRVVFVVLLAVTGCGPVPVFFQEGADATRLRQDEVACNLSSLREVPQLLETRTTPVRYTPGNVFCVDGTCYRSAGRFSGGETFTIDRNEGLRAQAKQQCMADKGYGLVELPICPPMSPGAPLRTPAVLPPLNDQLCAVQRGSEGTFIVQQ